MPLLTETERTKIRNAPFDPNLYKTPDGRNSPTRPYVVVEEPFDAALFAHHLEQEASPLSSVSKTPYIAMFTDGSYVQSKSGDKSGGLAVYFRAFGITNGPFASWSSWMKVASGIVGTDSSGAELVAINLALETVLKELGEAAAPSLRLFVFADCQAALGLAQQFLANKPLSKLPGVSSQECFRLLTPLRKLEKRALLAECRYVPAHNATKGNIMADRYARKAALYLLPVDQWMDDEQLFKKILDGRQRQEKRNAQRRKTDEINQTPLGKRVRTSVEEDGTETLASKRRNMAQEVVNKSLVLNLGLPPSMNGRSRAMSAPPSVSKLLELDVDGIDFQRSNRQFSVGPEL
ncbi:hypothetical protein GGR57DRAFT_498681 [Xylariaceae sp. FL1272]|nr:hypothetical protein GGR57DRAFT_498681 [Xylariaceae sp. FL1272]